LDIPRMQRNRSAISSLEKYLQPVPSVHTISSSPHHPAPEPAAIYLTFSLSHSQTLLTAHCSLRNLSSLTTHHSPLTPLNSLHPTLNSPSSQHRNENHHNRRLWLHRHLRNHPMSPEPRHFRSHRPLTKTTSLFPTQERQVKDDIDERRGLA